MPVSFLKGDEPRAADSSDWFRAGEASLGKKLPIAVGTIRLVILRSEPLSGKLVVAVGASKAFPVPRLVLVGHTPRGDDLAALDTPCGKLLLIAPSTVDLLLPRNEALGSNGIFADAASKAFLVPLTGLVFHFLGASTEHFATPITPGSKLGIVAVAAVDFLRLRSKLFVDQRNLALAAQEAGLMPMLVFVGQILRVNPNKLLAFIASVGENGFIASDTIRVFLP